MEKKDKKKKILKVSGLVALFLIVFGLSYALFTVTLNGTKKVKLKTAKLELQLLDKNNNPIYITDQNSTSSYEINLDNQVPVSDEEGLESTAFEFKLKNTGNLKASYTIYLDDVALEERETRIDDEYIRYSLTKNGSEDSAQALTSRELDKGTIDTDNTTYTYTLKIWVAEDATNEAMDKVFNATLRVKGYQYVAPSNPYGEEIASTQLSDTITATYYQPEDNTSYNNNKVRRMSNVKKIDNKEGYTGGTLVISGTGAMPGWGENDEDPPLTLFLLGAPSSQDIADNYDNYYDYVEDDRGNHDEPKYIYNPTKIIIEEGITEISANAFYFMTSVTNVELPETLIRIGTDVFEGTSITAIKLPGHLEIIDGYAFAHTAGIRSVVIPASVTTIESSVFYGSSLEELYIENSSIVFGKGGSGGTEFPKTATIYCKTQACYDNLQSQQPLNEAGGNANVVLDPTKFE